MGGYKVNLKHRSEWKEQYIKHENLLSHVKLGKEILMFGDVKIELYHYKNFSRRYRNW